MVLKQEIKDFHTTKPKEFRKLSKLNNKENDLQRTFGIISGHSDRNNSTSISTTQARHYLEIWRKYRDQPEPGQPK